MASDAVVKPNPDEVDLTPAQIIADYRLVYCSRQMSLLGRREVLNGRAKFGIFGDGKEVPQVALAHAFELGDFRSGYYRDQTLMLAVGALTVSAFFAQLYAHPDVAAEPASAGRLMNCHFATRSLNPDGSWRDLTQQVNSSADISPTASQMPRLVGLGQASKLYRELDELKQFSQFSRNGNEVAFGTIGNASCAEGMFWEAVNAIGVLRVPVVLSIWDDGYGISVPNEQQILKQDLSVLLAGFQREGAGEGFDLYTIPGWDYPRLVEVYRQATQNAREAHIPALVHVTELTQPQGHSTSGSHERYKSTERLQWEEEFDCLRQMRLWLIDQGIATEDELVQYEAEETERVRAGQQSAWTALVDAVEGDRQVVAELIDNLAHQAGQTAALEQVKQTMFQAPYPRRRDLMSASLEALRLSRTEKNASAFRCYLRRLRQECQRSLRPPCERAERCWANRDRPRSLPPPTVHERQKVLQHPRRPHARGAAREHAQRVRAGEQHL
jgi:TPP-dependent pyruvate/acetoin dehydrogenase alpha subunit